MGLVTGATVKKNFSVLVFIPWLESSIGIFVGNLYRHYGNIKSKLIRKNLVIVILSRVVLIISKSLINLVIVILSRVVLIIFEGLC